MSRLANRLLGGLSVSGVLAALVLVPSMAGAAVGAVTTHTCSGSPTSPGVLSGTYPGNVVVRGFCVVNAGPTVVRGNLAIAPGGGLVAAFAFNDRTHRGFSRLTVRRNVTVGRGAALVLGCEANFFPCLDDTGKPPTFQSRGTIGGGLFASRPLGVLVHSSTIRGSVIQRGGGGGVSCASKGIFKLFQSPVFSDYEDSIFGSSVNVTGVHSCWLGLLRNTVRGSFAFRANIMADPDANEVLQNYVNRSLTCFGNVPAVQYGDSTSNPNVVAGRAAGQCSFRVRKPNPAPNGPLTPISIRATG